MPLALAQQERPVFRAGTDLVVVDVQVVDRKGQPILGLAPADFEVRIDRQPRRVASVELVRFDQATPDATPPVSAAASAPSAQVRYEDGRNFVLAIDESSFHPLHAMAAREAVRRFVRRLNPADRVGLYKYPVYGAELVLTTDHQEVLDRLDGVVGVLDVPQSESRLTMSEIIDITAGDQDVLGRVAERECPSAPGLCRKRIEFEAQSLALAFEGQVGQSVQGLRTLLRALATYQGRKTLVLVSGGLLAGDRAGGRPDVTDMIGQISRESTLANVNLYVLHLDNSFIDAFSPKGGGARASFMRDSQALGAGLERFAGTAGGALFRVQAGTGDYAFDRVLTETRAHYLLGVEADPADRDGRPHTISVSVRRRGADVRNRTTVVIPRSSPTP
jgi:VWFA-related protein